MFCAAFTTTKQQESYFMVTAMEYDDSKMDFNHLKEMCLLFYAFISLFENRYQYCSVLMEVYFT